MNKPAPDPSVGTPQPDEQREKDAMQFGQMRGGWTFEQAWAAWLEQKPELIASTAVGTPPSVDDQTDKEITDPDDHACR